MLDLNLLEKQLDEVLAIETSETMISWLLDRRLKKYINDLGEGVFTNLPTTKVEIIKKKERPIINNNSIDFSENLEVSEFDYFFAA
ncbi:MAG: hypothetical protein ACOVLC_04160 [Flavobacterium sp.]